MRFKHLLIVVPSISLFLAGCGGAGAGGNTTPYDGNWSADYPALSQKSEITATQSVICNSPPATLIINKSEGSATQTATCVTSTITSASGVPPTSTVIGTQSTVAYISISISPHLAIGSSDVVNALVNGVTHTGQCISNNACSAVSTAGNTLSLTRK